MAKASLLTSWQRTGLLAVALLLFGIHSSAVSSNDASRLALVESLLKRGVPYTDESRFFNTVDMIFKDGHFYSDKPPILSLYTAAVLFPFKAVISLDSNHLYLLAVITSAGIVLLTLPLLTSRIASELGASTEHQQWTTYATIVATPLLPFLLVYSDHSTASGLVLATLWLLLRYKQAPHRTTAAGIGCIMGILLLLHPLAGIIFTFSTLLLVLLIRRRDSVTYVGGVSSAVMIGTVLHFMLYGSVIPFYFQPSLYLYGPSLLHPNLPSSHWLEYPAPPGLTEAGIIDRFHELQIPKEGLDKTISALHQYRDTIGNPLTFAWEHWQTHDFITFNPLIIFCLTLIVSRLKYRPTRKVYLWILLNIISLYCAVIVLRAVPGVSFGNRYLLPLLPLILMGSAPALRNKSNFIVFQLCFWVSMAMVIPGTQQPWYTPDKGYRGINQAIVVLSSIGIGTYWISATVRSAAAHLGSILKRHLILCAGALALLIAVEVKTFAPDNLVPLTHSSWALAISVTGLAMTLPWVPSTVASWYYSRRSYVENYYYPARGGEGTCVSTKKGLP